MKETCGAPTVCVLFLILAAIAAAPVLNAHAQSIGAARNTGSMFDTTFDLGFDVSGIPHTGAATREFVLGLPAAAQPKVLAACAHFLDAPVTAQSPETLAFCSHLILG